MIKTCNNCDTGNCKVIGRLTAMAMKRLSPPPPLSCSKHIRQFSTNKLISAVTNFTLKGFKTSGIIERKFNDRKNPIKTTLPTTGATMALLKPYNQ